MPFRVLLWDYLLIVPHVLLVPVLIGLARRRLYRQFPMFAAYMVGELIQAAIILPMMFSHATTGRQYAIAYSISVASSTALQFGVIHEIFAQMFRNYSVLSRFGKPAFRWSTVALLLAGLALASYTGGHDLIRLESIVHVLDRAGSILQCGLLIGLFLLSSYLGLSWRSYLFGIALGLGVIASMDLVVAAIHSETGYTYNLYLNYLTMATYHASVLIWIVYLFSPERISQYELKALPENDLESWNRELQRLLNQ